MPLSPQSAALFVMPFAVLPSARVLGALPEMPFGPALALVVALVVVTVVFVRRELRRRIAESAVREGRRYRDLVDDVEGVVWEADAVTLRPTFVSRRIEEYLGFPAARFVDDPGFWLQQMHPGDRRRVRALARQAIEHGRDHHIDFRMTAADGRQHWLRDRVHVIRDESGQIVRLRGLTVDVTELRTADEQVRSTEARHGAIIESSLDAVVSIDGSGRITEFNPAAERMFDYTRGHALGRAMDELIIPPDLQEAHRRGFARFRETGESHILDRRIELTARRADATEFPVELSIRQVPDATRTEFTAFIRDITDRVKGERELRDALSLLTATLESTADGILVVNHEGRAASHNRKFAEMWRIPAEVLESRDDERLIGSVLSQLVDPEAFLQKVRELYAHPEAESFDLLEFKDGRLFERYSLPRRIDGRAAGRVWSFRDVTERRRTEAALRESEQQLRQSQKMDAVGRLAGGVAHDFNNLLTVILGHSEQLLERLPTLTPLHAGAEEIRNAAERAAALTQQLLAFSRKQLLEPRELDLNTIVATMDRILRRLIGENITLTLTTQPHLGVIKADESQLEQVILNLAINARDAMPRGGQLTLATGHADLEREELRDGVTIRAGRYVTLTVADSGAGMDEDTRGRIFEPFFTTKERGKGTGLGLATVYGVVKQSGGYILVESEVGRGSTFRIYLPRVDASARAAVVDARSSTHAGVETVLLVEDEEKVRLLVRDVLGAAGYRVLEAESGDEALEFAAGYDGAIHLLVTDVVMPGLSGPQVASRLAAARPGVRTLYLSGYPDDDRVRADLSKAAGAFLQKPFTRAALERKVREVLDASVRAPGA